MFFPRFELVAFERGGGIIGLCANCPCYTGDRMKTKNLHDWDLSYSQAREVQTGLAGEVRFTPLRASPKVVAGIDCAFS